MLIRSKINRAGGTKTLLRNTTYHFTPNEHGHHVCDVVEDDDIAALLAIPEGYAVYTASAAAEKQTAPQAEPVAAPAPTPAAPQGDVPPITEVETEEPFEAGSPFDQMDDAELAEKFNDLFGRLPRENSKRETIIERIEAKTAENAAEAATPAAPE